jgi:hypothetical protein
MLVQREVWQLQRGSFALGIRSRNGETMCRFGASGRPPLTYLLQPAALIRDLGRSPARQRASLLTNGGNLDGGLRPLAPSHVRCINRNRLRDPGEQRPRQSPRISPRSANRDLYLCGDDRADFSWRRSAAAWGVLPTHRFGTAPAKNPLLVRSLYSYERPMPALRSHETLDARFRRRYRTAGPES